MSFIYLGPFICYCWLYIMVAFGAINTTLNPKRLRSVLTLVCSSVLTPLSFYQTIRQFQQPHVIYKSVMQTHMILFYLAYCLVDTIFANVCCPEYFSLLEGWIHHISTGLGALYYLNHEKQVAVCICFILETSTIVMSLFRIFYDKEWALFLRDNVFRIMFVIFRLVLPNYFMYYFYDLIADSISLSMIGLNTAVNMYWLQKLCTKKIKH